MLLETDWAFISASLEELEAYLKSKQVYWPLSGPASLPRLTLGSLLVSLARLEAHAITEVEPARVSAMLADVSSIRSHWQALWQRKAALEFPQRLTLWSAFLSDLKEEGVSRAEYAAQVHLRLMLDLLLAETPTIQPAWPRQLEALDVRLQTVTRPAPFVWRAELEPGFPPDKFWYLYRGW